MLHGRRVLLGVSGGVAAFKAAYLARRLVEDGAEVRSIMTRSARHFLGPQTLAAITGTDYQLDVRGKLLFIEDVGEKPYRIDRMLTQLRQAYPLEKTAGIALGVFSGFEANEDDNSLTLRETLLDRLADLDVPIMYGLPFGHIDDHCTLPVGLEAELDTVARTIRLLGSAVS